MCIESLGEEDRVRVRSAVGKRSWEKWKDVDEKKRKNNGSKKGSEVEESAEIMSTVLKYNRITMRQVIKGKKIDRIIQVMRGKRGERERERCFTLVG